MTKRTADKRVQLARYLLLGSVAVLILGGLVMVYSASFYTDYVQQGDSALHLKKQLLFLAFGLVAMVIASRWDYRARSTAGGVRGPAAVAWAVWGLSMAGLMAVVVTGVGKWGAQRWLSFGSINVQPSEFAKLGCVLVVAVLASEWRAGRLPGNRFVLWVLLSVLPVAALVLAQPDMGTAMAIVIAVFLVLFLAGVRVRHLAAVAVPGVAVAALLVWVASYRFERLVAFLDPWADPLDGGYQIIQATYAFGSGGVGGVGLGLSRQKFFYLPAAHTDFILAIIGEEAGIVGTLLVVLAFVIFAYAGFRIALSARDTFGRLVAGGLTAMVLIQALMNMAAVTGLMPVTGIPLPLVSYGGSSLTFTMGCIGIILAVSTYGVTSTRLGVSGGNQANGATPRAHSGERRWDGRPRLSGIDGGKVAVRRRA